MHDVLLDLIQRMRIIANSYRWFLKNAMFCVKQKIIKGAIT